MNGSSCNFSRFNRCSTCHDIFEIRQLTEVAGLHYCPVCILSAELSGTANRRGGKKKKVRSGR